MPPSTLKPSRLKPHKTFDEQLELLASRGLSISDPAAALATLERVGYYRLSGYFYPLRKARPDGQRGRQDAFHEGASFEVVEQLVEFDQRLRLMAMQATELIEVSARVAIAHRLGHVDVEAHLRPHLLDGKFTSASGRDGDSAHQNWLARFEHPRSKSREEFIEHHLKNYGGRLPIWVAIEIWDFGLLSRFFSGLKFRDKCAIANLYGIQDGDVLRSWLRSINFVRNIAAHHSRL